MITIISLRNSVFAVVIALALSACSNVQVNSLSYAADNMHGHIDGHSITLYNAGEVYVKHKDYKTALNYFLRSAELGNSRAMIAAGVIYATGEGVLINRTKAKYWINMAYNRANAAGDAVVLNTASRIWKRFRLWKY